MLNKKPISEKQLAANRANAQKSTGPSSAEGKQTVGLNALKHGFTGQIAVLPGEDHDAHEAFCTELIDEYAPATATEFNLAQSIAHDLWRLNRAAAIETNILGLGIEEDDPDPDHDPAMQIAFAGARTFLQHANKFALLSLYEQRIHRAVHKNRADLRQMQDARRSAKQVQPEAERPQAEQATAAPGPLPADETQTKSNPNGFVYANDISGRPFNGLTLVKAA